MITDEIVESILETVEDDYLDLTDIIYHVRHQAEDDPTLLRIAATVAATLVRQKKIVPGRLTKEGFLPWLSDPEESAQRIIREADAMATAEEKVYFGDIAWFDTPEAIAKRAAGDDPSRPHPITPDQPS